MIFLLIIIFSSTASIITLCSGKSKKHPRSSNEINPPPLCAKDAVPIVGVTPSDSQQPLAPEPSTPLDGIPRSNEPSPSKDQTTGTPFGSDPNDKKKEEKNQSPGNMGEKQSMHSQVSGEILVQTLTAGPDSLMEKGQTTRTHAISDYQYNGQKKATKLRSTEIPERTLASAPKKASKDRHSKELDTQEHDKGKEKGRTDELKEKTSRDPTDEKEKKTTKEDKEDKKTKEDKISVEGKLSTPPSVNSLDNTQRSQTRK